MVKVTIKAYFLKRCLHLVYADLKVLMKSLSLGPPDNEGGHDHGDDEHGGHNHRALSLSQKSRRERRSTIVGNTTWDEVK